MSKRALFRNTFQQIKRLWKCTVNLEERVITLEHRIYDDDDGIVRRVNALEDVAHTPSEAECKPQGAGMPTTDMFPLDITSRARLVDILNALDSHKITKREAVEGIEQLYAKPALTTSEPTTGMTFHKNGEITTGVPVQAPAVRERLWVFNPKWRESNFAYYPATLPQIRQVAVAMGLLDTPRQKVAEAFLHAALDNMNGGEDSYTNTARLLYKQMITQEVNHIEWSEGIVGVLEQAARESNG